MTVLPATISVGPADEREAFRPTTLDLILAIVVAIGVPIGAAALLSATGGALAGLMLYYGVACLAIVRWRRGALGYGRPVRWPWPLFLASLLLPLAFALITRQSVADQQAPLWGVLLTALIWAPINASLEQLSWVYVLDSWRLRWQHGWVRWLGLVAGILLIVTLVGAIHALFWGRFLPSATAGTGAVTAPLNLLLTASYVLLSYQARSMWPTFIIHLLVNLQLVLIANYSIVPDL